MRHLTKFRYDTAVSESVMETRMHPRTDGNQLCLNFHLSVSPRCRLFSYRDYMGNHIHHFDIPVPHEQLVIVAESLVEAQPLPEIPARMAPEAWAQLDGLIKQEDCWEMLLPSEFVTRTPMIEELSRELGFCRRDDPLTVLRQLNEDLGKAIEYVPKSTSVNSPIDDALRNRKGVCQDFAHIMIGMVRRIGIPCRYVSGYIHPRKQDAMSTAGNASHAWVEALLPYLGWVGFDPTNHILAGQRHIRIAIGRDYADVPPTKGIFRGHTGSELTVAVRVSFSAEPPAVDSESPIPGDWSMLIDSVPEPPPMSLLQQQQQQQQQ
ncbi:MAG TPA: transglutaminase family protein [Candidatus Dormibacteraeota bacterium]|nr:transglutaminase family protein [Candidatus Dormibacteraeota bacterium]